MQELDYLDRTVNDVYVWALEQVTFPDGDSGITGTVKFGLSGASPGSDGPQITVVIGHKVDGDITIRAAEKILIGAALRALGACQTTSIDAALVTLDATRGERILKPSED